MEFHGPLFRDDDLYKENWKLTRTFFSQTCSSSGEEIPMFTPAYLYKYDVQYAAGAIKCRKWLTESEYLIKKLKDEV